MFFLSSYPSKRGFAGAGSVDVSREGRLLFVSQDEQKQFVVMACDLPACTARRTQPFSQASGRPRWMPDGRAIAVVVPDPPPGNIWVQPLDGGAPRQLTHFTGDYEISDFAWSRDGKRLAVSRSKSTSDIVLFKGLRR